MLRVMIEYTLGIFFTDAKCNKQLFEFLNGL